MQPQNPYPDPYQQNPYQPMPPVQPEQPPVKKSSRGKIIGIATALLLLVGGGVAAGLLLKPACTGSSCNAANENPNPDGIQINGNLVSGGNIFGLNYVHFRDAHDDNLVIAKYVEDLEIHKSRYDIAIDELDGFVQIDEFMEKIPDEDWLMVTLRSKRLDAVYPENIDAYLTTVRDLASRYKSDVDVWQIEHNVYSPSSETWNSDKYNYTKLLNQAYDTIKTAHPEAKVIAAGLRATGTAEELLALPSPDSVEAFVETPEVTTERTEGETTADFLSYVLKHGRFDSIFDIHIYKKPEAINEFVPKLRSSLEAFGRSSDILVSETGSVDPAEIVADSKDDTSKTEQRKRQAQELAKRYVYLAQNNVLAGLWQDMYQPTARYSNYAFIVTDDRLRLPAYHTLKLLNKTLGGYTEVAKLADGQYRFAVDDQHYFIVWGEEGTTVDLSSYTSAVSATAFAIVTKLDDRLQPVVPPDQRVSLKSLAVGPTPLLVRVDNYYEEDFQSSDETDQNSNDEATTEQQQ